MKTTNDERLKTLQNELDRLRDENARLKEKLFTVRSGKTVIVPDEFTERFASAEQNVRAYFEDFSIQPETGEIMISGERYILFKSSSLSYHFLDIIKELYSNRTPDEATRIGNNFLFDIAYVLGKKDAVSFHEKMKLTDAIERQAAGPVHFAYTGWANVELLAESRPTLDEHHYVKFIHHNSFEAQAWKKAGRKSDIPVCTMSCGYSSGWCEESFGMPLIAVEITCEAAGDDQCTFIMAPPDKIASYLPASESGEGREKPDIPVFFEKKYAEDRLRESLEQKEMLLHELHHRVKNNLQMISSLMNLQMNTISDESLKKEFRSGMMRISTMARIHEMIYSDRGLTSLQLDYYFRHLFLSLVQGYHASDNPVETEIDIRVSQGTIDPDKAIPLGLILNEIVENAFDLPVKAGCALRLELTETPAHYQLQVHCYGQEPPERVQQDAGLSLVSILCEQLEAVLRTERQDEKMSYQITLKKTTDKAEHPIA